MEKVLDERGVFNLAEAAKFAGVSTPTVGEWVRREGFPAFKSGRRWLIPREPFIAWLNDLAARRAQL